MFIRSSFSLSLGLAILSIGQRELLAGDFVFAPVGQSTRRDLPENWDPFGGPIGSTDKEVSIAEAGGTGGRTTTAAQIPDGFELVWITFDPELDDSRPKINNCGEIVFMSELNDGTQIRLYDNGLIRQLTFDEGVENEYPDINNQGVITWKHDRDEEELGDIVVWHSGETSVVGYGRTPRINDAGQMVWAYRYGTGCSTADGDMFLYDGGDLTQLTEDFLSNQSPAINLHGHVVWTHYNFCPNPWLAFPAYYDGNQVQLLPSSQPKAIGPDTNDSGLVAWGGDDGIEVWKGGTTSLLTDWGTGAKLNNLGDIAILRFHDENNTWQVWLYSNDQFYQITDGPIWHASSDINDHGEISLTSGNVQERLIRLMRRIRNGDVDFDGTVSAADFSTFPSCTTGPVETDRLCDCRLLDLDHDRDVDLQDYAQFANSFGDL